MNTIFSLIVGLLIFLNLTSLGGLVREPEVGFNGTFSHSSSPQNWRVISQNHLYFCRYDVEAVSDELRRLKDFRFYENGELRFSLDNNIPGDDLYISNTGYIAFIDLSQHFKAQTTVHFFTKHGELLFSRSFTGGSFFQFSPSGNKFGLTADNQIIVITLPEGKIQTYPNGFQWAFSEDDQQIAVAQKEYIRIYENDQQKIIYTGLKIPRKLALSESLNKIIVIDKRNLKIYSLSSGELFLHDKLSGNISFRDLTIEDGYIYAGLHDKSDSRSSGILRKYDRTGRQILEKMDGSRVLPTLPEALPKPQNYWQNDSLPWPFAPFDSMPEIWNHYEQHMGGYGSGYSYLHQGLDIITPIGEPTYTVEAGIVKCVLTIGGASYWRLAISEEQLPGYTDGWLYAHLIESSIQVEVGDTVQLHEYLGDIIEWSSNWGHIHFVQIRDSGLVWQYNDNEWGINFNPLLVLKADPDTISPVIQNVFPDSKFAFCINETSQYLDPDSLYGDIDIIVKVNDYCGFSTWTQPAFSLYYQVKSLPTGDIIFPRIMAQVLNHSYPFYSGSNYEPYATLFYKRDDLLLPSSWMSTDRNYYHILTNNNGDSLAELSEKSLAFITSNYPDGWYRIIVEAYDEYGNFTVDSMEVRFKNAVSSLAFRSKIPGQFTLEQNYPNPFNPTTSITYTLPQSNYVSLIIYDLLGKEVQTLVNEYQTVGSYSLNFDASHLSSSIYFYQLKVGNNFVATRKMLLMR